MKSNKSDLTTFKCDSDRSWYNNRITVYNKNGDFSQFENMESVANMLINISNGRAFNFKLDDGSFYTYRATKSEE